MQLLLFKLHMTSVSRFPFSLPTYSLLRLQNTQAHKRTWIFLNKLFGVDILNKFHNYFPLPSTQLHSVSAISHSSISHLFLQLNKQNTLFFFQFILLFLTNIIMASDMCSCSYNVGGCVAGKHSFITSANTSIDCHLNTMDILFLSSGSLLPHIICVFYMPVNIFYVFASI